MIYACLFQAPSKVTVRGTSRPGPAEGRDDSGYRGGALQIHRPRSLEKNRVLLEHCEYLLIPQQLQHGLWSSDGQSLVYKPISVGIQRSLSVCVNTCLNRLLTQVGRCKNNLWPNEAFSPIGAPSQDMQHLFNCPSFTSTIQDFNETKQ